MATRFAEPRVRFWHDILMAQINLGLVEAAARIITSASRDRPADYLLRQHIKGMRKVPPGWSRDLSRAVFSYFRWYQWLHKETPVAEQIGEALRMADLFAVNHAAVPEGELLEKAVPGWASHELSITASWAGFLQMEPRLWLRARPGQGRELSRRLEDAKAFGEGPLQDVLEYTGQTDLLRTPSFHAGEFEIQDISSQAVGMVCAAKLGETWWDACAGEGGKLLHLSDLMQNKGLVWASDRANWRLSKLKNRARRAQAFNYRVAVWDGGASLPTRTLFDGVLVDAPCSGLGTWHRNPHARWTTTAADVAQLSGLQKSLLMNAAKAVKRGGRLIYSVCTLTRSETSEVCEALAASCPEMEPLLTSNPLEAGLPPRHGALLPGERYGGNGM